MFDDCVGLHWALERRIEFGLWGLQRWEPGKLLGDLEGGQCWDKKATRWAAQQNMVVMSDWWDAS